MLWGINPRFHGLSPCIRKVAYALRTRAPLVSIPKDLLPFDLHVLSLPLAFILSQDQTLRCIYKKFNFFRSESLLLELTKLVHLAFFLCCCSKFERTSIKNQHLRFSNADPLFYPLCNRLRIISNLPPQLFPLFRGDKGKNYFLSAKKINLFFRFFSLKSHSVQILLKNSYIRPSVFFRLTSDFQVTFALKAAANV